MTLEITKHYSPEEYLILEEIAEYKNEYLDGEIIPMTGGTTNHNRIALNLSAYLKFALKGKNYEIFIGDVKVSIPQYRLYTYPDVMILSGKPIYEGEKKTVVTNPLLITEVLSASTKNYDMTEKFRYYRSLPSLQEYLLIEQSSYSLLQYTKTLERKWLLTEYEGDDAILSLVSIPAEISFQDLYEGVDFSEVECL